jgi:hypothetical protein
MPQRLTLPTTRSKTPLGSHSSPPEELPEVQQLLGLHHYLGSLKSLGERFCNVVTVVSGDWRGVLVFCAAPRLRPRLQWIGRSEYCNARPPALTATFSTPAARPETA